MSRSFSLEYAQATYRPLKHRFIKKWVYRLVIAFIHLWKIICRGTIQEITDWKLNLIMVYSSFLFLIVFICICYISIYIKVHRDRLFRHHDAAGLRERKLTRTLCLVTCSSLLTFLPIAIDEGMVYIHIIAVPKFSLHL